MSATIDLNADLGEGFGSWRMGADSDLLDVVTSANVACGFHAGDPKIMDRTVALCVEKRVAIGAHPSYFDLRGFGRRTVAADPTEVETDVLYQVGALAAFASSRGTALTHVKPHGALYNDAVNDPERAGAIARAIARAGARLVFVGLASSSVMRRAAEAAGLRFAAEAFADRRYLKDGTLSPRSRPGSVLADPDAIARQALSIARDKVVVSDEGSPVSLDADTLCLHGDTPGAVESARRVREVLEGAGIGLRALAR